VYLNTVKEEGYLLGEEDRGERSVSRYPREKALP
jgi:hypothetical protein